MCILKHIGNPTFPLEPLHTVTLQALLGNATSGRTVRWGPEGKVYLERGKGRKEMRSPAIPIDPEGLFHCLPLSILHELLEHGVAGTSHVWDPLTASW